MNISVRSKLLPILLPLTLVACDSGEQEAVNQAFDLAGSNWQLLRIEVPGGFTFEAEDPGKYVLNFRSENRLTGNSDCNTINGGWQQEANSLRFEPLSYSTNLCVRGSLHNYLTLYLSDVVSHRVEDDRLYLTTTREGVELEFEARQ